MMMLVTSAVRTLLSIPQNGISPITLNKQSGNNLNVDIKNASNMSSFLYARCYAKCPSLFRHGQRVKCL
jgi:hypothetical protein